MQRSLQVAVQVVFKRMLTWASCSLSSNTDNWLVAPLSLCKSLENKTQRVTETSRPTQGMPGQLITCASRTELLSHQASNAAAQFGVDAVWNACIGA
jgi:hypothetical protein